MLQQTDSNTETPSKMKHLRKILHGLFLLLFIPFILTGKKAHAQQAQNGSWIQKFEMPKAFIENRGQFYVRESFGNDTRVLYGYDASETRIFFRKHGVTFNFTKKSKPEKKGSGWKTLEVSSPEEGFEARKKSRIPKLELDEVSYYWEGANENSEVYTYNKVDNHFSYSFHARGVEKHENLIPGYSRLVYKNLYPNIDVEYTFHPDNGIKYALIVHPGADLSRVKMVYSDGVQIDPAGNVVIGSIFGNIIDHAPVTFYQGNESAIIPSKFIRDGKTVSFELGNYDRSKTIVIDPWTATPALPNSNKVWECETSGAGDAFAYGGDSFIRLIKYNAAGAVQWTYTSPWDSANYWIGGFIVHPTTGESYMTSGSNGEIRKITAAGGVAWSNNPNGLTSYEYWSLAFNCDLTKLVVGGTRVQFSIPTPLIRGVVININLANGAQSGVTIVGFGSTLSIPPSIQEVSSICYAPNNNFYFLTLDTIGSINNALSAINFKTNTGYAFDYYIPGYGFGTKQPISAIRANTAALYSLNGGTVHRRSLANGAVTGTAAIPGGSYTSSFFGRFVNGNGGLDLDNNGNVYVGAVNSVTKFDANLSVITTSATSFAVYDVDVNNNGEVIACGWSGGTGYVQSLPMSAGPQMTYTCSSVSPMSATSVQTNVTCNGSCNGSATVTPSGGTAPYTYSWAPSGGTAATASSLCAGTYTCTVTDNLGATTTVSLTITQPAALVASAASQTNISCNGGSNGAASVTVSGGTTSYSYNWTPGNPTGDGTNSVTGLGVGTWTCTVTDANGCTTTQTFSITQPAALSASAASQTNISCNGGANGAASVTVSGGTTSYSYNWTPGNPTGDGTASVTGLTAGTWTCTVTDANSCTTTQTFSITAPSALSASAASQTNVTCNGGTTGAASVTVSGGTTSYTYDWTPGSPTGDGTTSVTGLTAGTYTCTVTDANGCSTTQTFSITEPTAVSASVTSTTDASCGNNNGAGTVSASGGSGSYTYSWAPSGGTAATATGLGAATYTVTVTDGNGCTTTTNVVINNTGGPTVSLSAQQDVTCFGGSTGSATINATGTGTLTYSWSPSGGTAATATGLPAGTYTCTVTDGNGCISTQTVTITEPAQLTATTSAVPATCGNNNGSATASPAGGTGSYTYSWAPSGGTAATENNLAAASYTCTITDGNGCTTTASVTVTSTGGPTVSLQSSGDVACFGGNTGTATVSASGNSPFTYSWSPSGGTNATATGLPAGTYTCTVTDASSCISVQTVTITEPPQLTGNATATAATCGNTNGSATVTPTGGTGPYTYLWSNSQTTASITGLAGGTYSVTITDANGCTGTANAIVGNTGAPTVSVQSSGNVSCFGGNNGTATVSASGGSSPYTYAWSPSGGNAATANSLAAGTYTVTVTGSDGCSQTQTVTITAPPAIQVNSTTQDETCGSGDGSALVAASGGNGGPYTYLWSNSATTSGINNLNAGTYTVTVTDVSGCTSSSAITIANIGTAVADAGTSVTISQGQSTTLNGSGGTSYSWSPPVGLSCTNCQAPVATPAGTTTYTLTVTDSLGCTDTDTVTVFVDITCGEIYLPNAFSPNGDLQNDVLFVRGNCIKFLQFDVYNRWGEKVFTTTDPALGWDGTWRSKPCEAAVFTYVLRATLLDDTEVEKQGNITLVK
ncbi:MAG: hypothetical protein FD123_1285 [Bacteroidetes bacterium]|nr:MAG: hypothetical protein FD123_1285 [Bacteroidota bacterium]